MTEGLIQTHTRGNMQFAGSPLPSVVYAGGMKGCWEEISPCYGSGAKCIKQADPRPRIVYKTIWAFLFI